MKKSYLLFSFFALALVTFLSCSKSDSEYVPLPQNPAIDTTPRLDLTKVPFAKLSDYNFFLGDLKNLSPALDVLPYEPASSLFADYAHKKRFVYVPKDTKVTYNGDENVFEFPVGSVLIKSFYYDNVMPDNVTKIIETRFLVRKNDGWKAYEYIWNATQTEANLQANGNGTVVPITWMHNGVQKNINYETPAQGQCITCHNIKLPSAPNVEKTTPIGPKPQNLNTNYNYNGTTINQIAKWRAMGYLGNDVPATINSTVDYKDTSKSLELRARSYLDINCAHCHRQGGHCDRVPQRLDFNNTNMATLGLCLAPATTGNGTFIINGGNADDSGLVVRMSSDVGSVMMPYIGRTIVHEEGIQLIKDWINSLDRTCR